MTDPIELAEALFRVNLEATAIREDYCESEQIWWESTGWPLKVLRKMVGSLPARRRSQGKLRLAARRKQLEQAIEDLGYGLYGSSIELLESMGLELWWSHRIGFFRKLTFDSIMYYPPRPVAPGAEGGRQQEGDAFLLLMVLAEALRQMRRL